MSFRVFEPVVSSAEPVQLIFYKVIKTAARSTSDHQPDMSNFAQKRGLLRSFAPFLIPPLFLEDVRFEFDYSGTACHFRVIDRLSGPGPRTSLLVLPFVSQLLFRVIFVA